MTTLRIRIREAEATKVNFEQLYFSSADCHDRTPGTLLSPLSHCSMSFILARSATLSRALPLIVSLVTLLFLAPIVFPCI